MSNPAVFKLNRTTIQENVFQIEDNIGEAIHFHIGLVRFDLSIQEFDNITQVLLNVLNNQVNIHNFDLRQQNEYFLERIAAEIPYIVEVKEISVNVHELKYRFETKDGVVEDYLVGTPLYDYYKGKETIANQYILDKEIWEGNEELLDKVKTCRNNQVFIDDGLFVLDGYKSLCAGLAFEDIDEEIKVKQIILSPGKSFNCVLKKEIEQWWMHR